MIPSDPGALRERERLAALERYEILDTPPEEAFDRITRLTSRVLGVPIALVSLVDATRQWFKSSVGIRVSETPRGISFCTHAIDSNDVFVVEEPTRDPRFLGNPLVLGDPYIRFYAGAPLVTSEGARLGTLCIIDRERRTLDADDRGTLIDLAGLVVDAMEMRLTAIELHREQQRTKAILDSLGEGVIVSDLAGNYTIINPAAKVLLGLSPTHNARGLRDAGTLLTEDGAPLAMRDTPLARALRGEDTTTQRVSSDVHGVRRMFSVSGRPVRGADGKVEAAVATFVDVTEADRAQRQLRLKANTDGLTGIANRASLDAHLELLKDGPERVTVMMLDLDHFKRLNDTLGHVEGDRVLALAASVLQHSLRGTDFVARYGGEEFCVVLTGVGDDAARAVAEKLRAAIEKTGRATASVGVCSAAAGTVDPKTTLACADKALFAAKRAGRNRVEQVAPAGALPS